MRGKASPLSARSAPQALFVYKDKGNPMAQKKFEFILSASTTGWNSVNKAKQGLNAFNREVSTGTKLMDSAKGQIAGLLGAYLGFNTLSSTAAIIKKANSAIFTLDSSLTAANREFDNVGSLETWGETIDSLSSKLKIYSKTDIRDAAASTVDMTKRLGLSQDQMEQVIARTAALSAGKVELSDGIERVTAALRGEAEASERLALTLNETYVKSWYEAAGAQQGAWKDLDDLQKAQVRYQVFLEQSASVQDRAAESVTTLGGAYSLVKAQITDAITENKEMTEVVAELARYLTENSEQLSDMAVSLASSATAAAKWVVENRDLIATLGKWALAFYAVNKAGSLLMTTVRGIQAATVAMTGAGFVSFMTKLRAATTGVALGMGATFTATMGVAGAFVFAAVEVKKLIDNYYELKQLEADISSLRQQNADSATDLAKRFADISKATGVTVTSMKELDQAVADGLIQFNRATGEWVGLYDNVSAGAENSANKQKQVTGAALDEMKKQYQEYADEVQRLQNEIVGREQSLYEQLRSIARTGMSNVGAWNDIKAEAEEYRTVAEAAAEAGKFDVAITYADKAKQKYAELNREVKDGDTILVSSEKARKAAMEGVEASGELAIKALQGQQAAAKEAMEVLTEKSGWQNLATSMDDAKQKWIDNWSAMQDEATKQIDTVEARLDKIVKERDVYINVHTVEQKSSGGSVGVLGFSGGGSPAAALQQFSRLARPYITSGSGVKDDVPAMLKRNEYVQPMEAVKYYGVEFMEMIRRRMLPKPMHFATGGTPAGAVSLPASGSGSGVVMNNSFNFSGDVSAMSKMTAKKNVDLILTELEKRFRGAA